MTAETVSNDTTNAGSEDTGVNTSSDDSNSAPPNSDIDYGDMSLDDLLNADFSDDPIMGQEHRGLPHFTEVLKHVPEQARKLVSNLRADATRKTQALADARRSLDEERRTFQLEKDALYNGDFAKRVQQTASQDTEGLDIYDEAGLQKRIEVETARKLQDMLKPMQEQMVMQQRQHALESFRAAHPDMVEPAVKAAIIKELTERTELRLEDAYHIVKGRMASDENARLRSETNIKKSSQRQVIERTGGNKTAGSMKAPAGMTAWESFQFHKANGVK